MQLQYIWPFPIISSTQITMEIIIIAAMAANRVIGNNNKLPWDIPEETAFFKTTTMGYPVIMGRKTHESIGFPLPGRTNIILTRNNPDCFQGCSCADSLSAAFEMCKGNDRVFIIGGESVFSQAINLCTAISLSIIDREIDGDTKFPIISEYMFQEINRKTYNNGEPFTVVNYERRIK